MAQIFSKTGDITADTEWELDAIDLSQSRLIRMEQTAGAPTGVAGDHCDTYLVSRSQSGVYQDRIHLQQLDGNQSGTLSVDGTIQSDVPLSTAEACGPMPGPTTGVRLAENTVRNGAFPGVYYGTGAPLPVTGWKIIFDVSGGGSPTFPVTIHIDTQEMDPGF